MTVIAPTEPTVDRPVATRRPSARAGRIAAMAAIPTALVVSGLIIGQASYSAYSASTANPTSNWATGTVALADDDTNSAAFAAANLKPGASGTKCVVVTSNGTLASAVKLYTTSPATTKGLATYLNMSITQGSGGSFGGCTGYTADSTLFTGTLADLTSVSTNFSTGLGNWTPTGTAAESKTYQISYTVNAAAPDSTQAGSAAVGFTWEAQNT